ncbi:MAG: CoB--CoM heterodisulfide reductase subunit C [Methanobrevibacter sp.]|jgi:heterodisulfide reductase subunit C|nr:CoB--CoM heterodisulfide reductase subunit C [Candidatus Methanovirga australis]
MSLIKRLKSLFGGESKDVIKNKSAKEAPVKIDIESKDEYSSADEITEEKTDFSVTKNSTTPKYKESTKIESKQNNFKKEDTIKTDTGITHAKEKKLSNEPSKKETFEKEDADKTVSKIESAKDEKLSIDEPVKNEEPVKVEKSESIEIINDESTSKEEKDSEDDVSEDDVKLTVKENEVTEEKDKKGDKMSLLEENLVIRPESVDKEFTQLFVDAGIDTVEHCFQCGTCSGGCPSGRRTPYKVRQVVRKCLMGLKDEVISDPALWMCTTCYTCQERCPRSVKIVEIIKLARNEAAKAGFMAPAHRATGSFVIKTGHGVPINDATKTLRKKVGLSELPPTTHSDAKALEDIRTICKATGFDKLIGYNMETNELME